MVTCTQLSFKDRERLLALYGRGIRAVCGEARDADIVPLMSRLKLVKLQVRWLTKLLVFGYRCLSKPPVPPDCLVQLFSTSAVPGHQTRGQSTVAVRLPRRSSKCGRNALDNRVAILWNKLPAELRCSPSTSNFKCKLHKFLANSESCDNLIHLAFCPPSEL